MAHRRRKTSGQKRSRPEGGGFRWIGVLGVGLEEDDAADLEQIPIVEALADMLLAVGNRRNRPRLPVDAAIREIGLDPGQARCRPSWCCHRAKTCMAAESISCTTPRPQRCTSEPVTNTLWPVNVRRHGEIRYRPRVAEIVDVGAEQAVEGAAERASVASELVVILTILAEQGGRAGRGPGLPPERLHVPDVGLRVVDFEEHRGAKSRIRVPSRLVMKLASFKPTKLFVDPLVSSCCHRP